MASKTPSTGTDARKAKIQAASKASTNGGGANKIILAAVAAVVAIVAVVGFVVLQQVSANKAVKGDGNATPAGATMGGPYAAFADVSAKPGAPTLEIFEDLQCPACKQFEASIGSTIEELAKAGDVKVQYHILHFLDDRLGNDGSLVAGNGAFCAADAGKFQQFHDLAYQNQPTEGAGWKVSELKPLAQQAGITGDALATWEKCVTLGRYTNYITAVNDNAFAKEGIKGTPTFRLNGKIVDSNTFATPEQVKAAIAAAKQ